tara:strand:+ start:575 stop:1414 length:840 start_codon:yes stop_codon:yes gene_type:complete
MIIKRNIVSDIVNMKKSHLVIFLVLSINFSFAQQTSVYPIGEKVRQPSTQSWGILFSYGAVNFNGDIKQYDFRSASDEKVDFDELRYAYNCGIRRVFNNGVIELSFSKGEMAGLKRYTDNEGDGDIAHSKDEIYDPYNNFDGLAEKFVNQFIEFNVSYLYPLDELNTFFTDFDFSVKAGMGMNIFTSQKRDLYTDEHIYSYGYEDDVNGDGKNSWSNAPRTSNLSIGLVGEYGITRELNLIFESTYKTSMDDTWDATPVGDNDSYYYFGIGIAYDVFDY